VVMLGGSAGCSLRASTVRKRWLAKFEHGDKWNFCLNSAMMPENRRDDDEAYPP